MANNKVSIYLTLRRFRRRIKSQNKRNKRKKQRSFTLENNRKYREIAKLIHSYEDALLYFMPRNLSYLTQNEKSPFYVKNLEKEKFKKVRTFDVPSCFSIIKNEKESFLFLKQIISAFVYQTCDDLWIDYRNCQETDLVTQIFLDAILLEIDCFIENCKKANIYDKYVRLASIGGKNMNNSSVRRLLNSVGSPAVLLNRQILYRDIIPYRLKRFDGKNLSHSSLLAQKEIDTTTLLDYVNSCLSRVKKSLNREAMKDLGYVVGETLINAEEHSSLRYR